MIPSFTRQRKWRKKIPFEKRKEIQRKMKEKTKEKKLIELAEWEKTPGNTLSQQEYNLFMEVDYYTLERILENRKYDTQDKPKKTIYDKPEILCLVKKTIVSEREIFEMTEYDFKEDSEYSESSDYE
tara:strand:- start:300 stop:680 length:381 start_codon:yes stop_codon:yes gene_type:complete